MTEIAISNQKKAPNRTLPSILEHLKEHSTSFIFPIILVLVWQILSSLGLLLEVVLPSPLKVLKAFREMVANGLLFIDIGTSGSRVLIGFFWGALSGLILGVASGLSKFIERLIGPVVDTFRQIPLLAWIPLIILWFGIGDLSKYMIIGKAVFIPVYVNTLQGIRGVSVDYVEVARVLELKYFKFLRKVVIPSALPSIFTGIRLGAGFAWMAVVAAEMLGGLSGLGYALLHSKDFLQSDKMITLMVVIGVIGLVVDRLILFIESIALHWRKGFGGNKSGS